MAIPRNALQAFYDNIKDCQRYSLASSRTQVVFGSGNPEADILFVGEALQNFFGFPMLHPAAALHRENLREAVREDFRNLRVFLDMGLQPISEPAHKQMQRL